MRRSVIAYQDTAQLSPLLASILSTDIHIAFETFAAIFGHRRFDCVGQLSTVGLTPKRSAARLFHLHPPKTFQSSIGHLFLFLRAIPSALYDLLWLTPLTSCFQAVEKSHHNFLTKCRYLFGGAWLLSQIDCKEHQHEASSL